MQKEEYIMLKKAISIFMIICLVTISSTNVFASNANMSITSNRDGKLLNSISEIEGLTKKKNLSSQEKNDIMNDVTILEEMGLGCFDLSSINISENKVSYDLQYENIIDTVTVEELSNGSIKLHFVEDDKESILIKTSDERLFLNGNEVIFDDTEVMNSAINRNTAIPSRAGFTFSTSSTCPYGSSSDYTYKAGTTNNANIAVGEFVKSIAVGALVSIMWAAILSSGIGAGVLVGSALSGAATSAIGYAATYDPTSKNLSFKATTYYHKSTNDYAINNTLKVKKTVTQWYVNKNYIGAISPTRTLYTYGVWG